MNEVQNNYEAQRAQIEANEAIKNAKVSALQAAHPELVPGYGCVIAAKNIRKELKKAFPGVRFSVTTEKFSMGNAIRVNYTDGPKVADVEAITDKYKGGHFDGMNDCYEYESAIWGDAFGTGKFITTSRNFSDQAYQSGLDAIEAKYGSKDKPTVEALRNGGGYNVTPLNEFMGSDYNWQTLVYRAMVQVAY